MSEAARKAGEQAARTSAALGTPLKTASDSGYPHPDSRKDYDRGVSEQQRKDSENRAR